MSTKQENTGDVASAHSIDKKFIETALRREENEPQLSVINIDVGDVVAKGENYASVLARVNVDYTTTGDDGNKQFKTRSLVVKSLPNGELMQNFVKMACLFEKEAHIYEVTLPAIYKLTRDKTGMDLPRLATGVVLNDRPSTIILDDLRPLGYKMADRRQGLDLHHSIQAIRTLAKLHGSSIALYDQDPSSMDFYVETFYTEENRKMLTHHLDGTFNNLANEVETWPGFERYGDKIRAVASASVNRSLELVKNREGRLRVLNHGDFWTNNMLFKYEDGKVVDVKMLDFQMVRFASPALDILYFLYASPSQHILENFQDQLVKEYHESLCETMKLLGCDEKLHVSLDEIREELSDKAYFSVIISGMFSIMVADIEEAPDLSQLTEANADTAGAEQLNKAIAGKVFRKTFERRLPKFEEQGLI